MSPDFDLRTDLESDGGPWLPQPRACALALLDGGLMCANIACFTASLYYGQASLVLPLANCSFLLTLVLALSTGLEQMNRLKGLAITSALGCIMLLLLSARYE